MLGELRQLHLHAAWLRAVENLVIFVYQYKFIKIIQLQPTTAKKHSPCTQSGGVILLHRQKKSKR